MIPDKPPRNQCPDDESRDRCNLQCRYNHFEKDALTIDAWELRCLDCGYRETIAYRSDDETLDAGLNPACCPFCSRCELAPGRNPCS